MIDLSELSKITADKRQQEVQQRLAREKGQSIASEKRFQDAINNLEQRLRDAASEGENKLNVAHFSAFRDNNVSALLDKKRGHFNNYCLAWGKTIFENDVIEHMDGNLKKVYEYLKLNNLNPKVKYWTDGGGEDEGFELVVNW